MRNFARSQACPWTAFFRVHHRQLCMHEAGLIPPANSQQREPLVPHSLSLILLESLELPSTKIGIPFQLFASFPLLPSPPKKPPPPASSSKASASTKPPLLPPFLLLPDRFLSGPFQARLRQLVWRGPLRVRTALFTRLAPIRTKAGEEKLANHRFANMFLRAVGSEWTKAVFVVRAFGEF
jgi:hypothetical protein